MIVALVTGLSVWAIELDSDGYYLIGSVDDWKAFAAIVAETPTVNAKMTANVNLGDDQTHIGSLTQGGTPYYSGVFDGRGHTLTVAYDGENNQIMGVFTQTRNATIKNLHVAGSIKSVYGWVGVVGRCCGRNNVISNVWNSAEITVQFGGWNWTGGIVGGVSSDNYYAPDGLSITDCLFTGSISTVDPNYTGCFIGAVYNTAASFVTVSNCLSTGTLTKGRFYGGTYNNCYVTQFPSTIPDNMQCTDEQLADGTIATALQAGRDEEVWVQGEDGPMLSIFANGGLKRDAEGYYLLGSAEDWDKFAAVVAETPDANARMIADIDLGNDQTYIGTTDANGPYSGEFDGQGHTLVVAYNSNQAIAPFGSIKNATIKNLHIDGSIHSAVGPLSCLAILARGVENISTVWVSANVTSSIKANDWSCFGVMVGNADGGSTHVNITDCLFSGTVSTYGKQNGFFLGYDGYNNRGTTTNCLSVGTFDYSSSGSAYFPGTYVNTYAKQFKIGFNTDAVPEEMQCTDEQLADGTIATALQAERDEVVWVQYGQTPMLRLFIKKGDVNGDGRVDISDVNAMINIILDLKSAEDYPGNADLTGEGVVDVSDVNAVINIILAL